MSEEKQIEEMTCEKCLHYEMCLEKFRNAKKDGFYEFVDEEEYFSHADECDFFVTGYRKQSEGEWEIVVGSNGREKMVCTNCRHQQDLASTFTYCPNCGAKMKGGAE